MVEQITTGSKKLDINFIVLVYIHELGQQLLKLPNEITDPNLANPVGCTYQNIVQSYCDGVDHLESMVMGLTDDPSTYKEDVAKLEGDDFTKAKRKIKCIISQCDRIGIMADKAIITTLDTPVEDENVINA